MRREGYSSRFVCVCVCVCVCMYVCHAHAILAVRAIKSVTKDTVVLNADLRQYYNGVFLKIIYCFIRKLERLLLTSAGAAIFS